MEQIHHEILRIFIEQGWPKQPAVDRAIGYSSRYLHDAALPVDIVELARTLQRIKNFTDHDESVQRWGLEGFNIQFYPDHITLVIHLVGTFRQEQ